MLKNALQSLIKAHETHKDVEFYRTQARRALHAYSQSLPQYEAYRWGDRVTILVYGSETPEMLCDWLSRLPAENPDPWSEMEKF